MMRKIFRKVSAIAASALMIGLTMGVAAAANYPAPFVAGGSSDVAIVYGASASNLDAVQAGNIEANLQSYMSGGTTSSVTNVNGEAVDLGTSGTRLYMSDTINKVKGILTKSDLPTVLADGTFSGNVDTTYSQTIEIGAYPNITFAKQPTSSDDPNLGIALNTQTSKAAFNMTVAFGKSVNFTSADSEGQDINLFGKTYTVGSATDATDLVLLQSATRINLDSTAPTQDVTVENATYTVELVSVSSSSVATISVTNKATGTSETKDVSEATSKKINGINIAVTTASENNLKYAASVVIGSQQITLTDQTYVKVGDQSTAILGTLVDFHGGNPGAGITKMTISVTASDSDTDALKEGQSLVDPVFGTVKLGLAGFNIEPTSNLREDIQVANAGDNKMQVTFTDATSGQPHTIQYAEFAAGGTNQSLYVSDSHNNMSVLEGQKIHRDDYISLGNEAEGHLLRVGSLYRAATGWSGDQLNFIDVLTGDTDTVTFASNTSTISTGTMVIGGKSYTVYLEGTPGIDYPLYNVSIMSPDSSGNNLIAYPTIATAENAKLAFYVPVTLPYIQYSAGGAQDGKNNLTGIMVPNGAKAYQTIAIGNNNMSAAGDPSAVTGAINVTCGSTVTTLNVNTSTTCAITNTGFTYNVSYSTGSVGTVMIQLQNMGNTAPETVPGIMLFEGKDQNNVYNGLFVETSVGSGSNAGAGVSSVERTWAKDTVGKNIAEASNDKLEQEMDLWGTIVTLDTSTNQYKADISYPSQQVYALTYIGSADSSISGGTSAGGGTQLGDIVVTDNEVSSVSSHNLIVVGGSCINAVAAKLLGGAYCGADFTSKTNVGSGQYLIESFGNAYTTGKIALLVAGYEATETGWAATYLRTQAVNTVAGTEYKGTSATTATLVTTQTA
jgi:hypothetical protein